MQNKLHIVTSGCSFTNNYRPNVDPDNKAESRWKNDEKDIWTWFHWLWKTMGSDAECYNYGAITNDNKTICRSIFYKVNDLIYNKGVKPEDIIVIAQWTSLTRNSFFVSPKLYLNKPDNLLKRFIKRNDSPPHTNDFLGWKYKENAYEHGYYYLTGGYYSDTKNPDGLEEFSIEYLNTVVSKEERYLDWFEQIIGLISYLENLGIKKIYSFQMNNNFSSGYLEETKTPPYYNEERKRINSDVYDCIIRDKIICNTWNDTNLNEENPYVKLYSDRINFDKYFWFFEEPKIHKMGGIIEWSIRNFNEKEETDLPNVLWREMNGMDSDDQRKYLNRSWYGHTSSNLARKFVNDVVLNWDIFKK